jgi:hypothetical protein
MKTIIVRNRPSLVALFSSVGIFLTGVFLAVVGFGENQPGTAGSSISARPIETYPYPAGVTTCVQPPPNMVSWWPGDGDPNDIQDGNNGTLQGGATFAPGEVGQAFSFNGTNQFVDVGDRANLENMSQLTVDAWVKFNSLNKPIQTVVSKAQANGPGTNAYIIFLQDIGGGDLRLTAAIENNSSSLLTLLSPDSFTDTTSFHHVALTYNGSTAAFYVDGVLKVSASFSGTVHDISSPFLIGKRDDPFGNGDTINGLVDEVEVFNRSLFQEEIQTIFNADSAGKCKPAVRIHPTPRARPTPAPRP